MPEPKIGHFKILRHLGRGSSMNAFVVKNENDNRVSVLKILKPTLSADPDTAERFIAATRAAGSITHPCVSTVLSAGRTGPSVYAETTFLNGRSLKETLAETGAMDPDYCVYLAKQVAALLNFSQRAVGAPHGGINPGNIILSKIGGKENVPAITDHGLINAALLSGAGFNAESAGDAVAYLSPEQLDGEAPGPAADIYSLGAVLFELLTGRPPFPGYSPAEIAEMHISSDPPRLRDINPDIREDLDEIVWKCLRKNPAERFAALPELISALGALSPAPQAAAPAAPTEAPEQPADGAEQPAEEAPQETPDEEEEAPEKLPYLDVDTGTIKIEGKDPALINIYNAGDAPLTGKATSPDKWLKISPRRFKVGPEEYFQVALSAGMLPSADGAETVVTLETDGGHAEVPVKVAAGAAEDGAEFLHTMSTVAAAALGGGYFVLGLASASMMGFTPLFVFAGFALVLAGAFIRRDRGLAVAGAAAVVLCAWFLLNFSKDIPAFAGEAAAGLLPAVIIMLAGKKILSRAPSVVAAIGVALLLWIAVQVGADTLRNGAPGVSFIIEAPMERFERRTVDNTSRSVVFPSRPAPTAAAPDAQETPAPEPVFVLITAARANIRSGPGKDYNVIYSGASGERFELLGETEGWMEIRLPDNVHGWLFHTLCETVSSQ